MFTCVRWRECSRREREREFEGWDYGRFFHCCCFAYVHALNFLHLTVITLVLWTSCHQEIQNSHGNISNFLSFTDWKSIVNNPVRFMICLAERVQMQAGLAPDLEKEGERGKRILGRGQVLRLEKVEVHNPAWGAERLPSSEDAQSQSLPVKYDSSALSPTCYHSPLLGWCQTCLHPICIPNPGHAVVRLTEGVGSEWENRWVGKSRWYLKSHSKTLKCPSWSVMGLIP